MDESKRIVNVKKDGLDIEIYLKNPSLEEREKAEALKLRKWNEAVKNGSFFYESLTKVLKEQNLWDDNKENKVIELQQEMLDNMEAIRRGGIKLSDARKLAIRIRQIRMELAILGSIKARYADICVEGQANNAEHNYLTSCVAVYNNERGKKYFSSYEDYINRIGDIDAIMISRKYAEIVYGLDDSLNPEEKFLRERNFTDDKGRLINKEGHLVDIENRLINEYGDYIKIEDGKEIIVDEDGTPIEFSNAPKPFLDDDGVPIEDKKEVVKEEVVST